MRDNAFFRHAGGSARRIRTMLLGVIAAISLVAACDGSNLFDEDFTGGSGSGGTPPTVAIVAPAPDERYHRGDAVRVQAQLADDGGVASVTLEGLAFTGDPTLGTDEVITRYASQTVSLAELPQDTLLLRDLFPVNTADTTSTIHIIVTARDEGGNVGSDTVRIQAPGGPDVDVVFPIEDGTSLVAGLDQQVSITATDEDGITSVYLVAGGIVTDTLRFPPISPPEATLALDTVVSLPAQAGTLTLQAFAVNTLGVTGASRVMSYPVELPTGPDTQPPTVRVAVTGRDRMELGDEIEVQVGARDDGGSGLARIGVTVLAVNSARTDTMAVDTILDFATPRGSADETFGFRPFNVDSLALPDTLLFEVHAFAVDDAGLEACAVSVTYEQLGCVQRAFPAGSANSVTLAAGATGQLKEVVVVSGRTVLLPNGGRIADAAVEMDTASAQYRLFLSNIASSQVEVLSLADSTFGAPVWVGSQPWGLFIDPSSDTLFVANSGGENISIVQLGATPVELTAERVLTPEAVLYEIKYEEDDVGRITYTQTFYGFSDRLQYIARDSLGRLLYSTEPTGAAPDGTVRVVDRDPDPSTSADQPEIRILFDPSEAIAPADQVIAVANIDSTTILHDPTGNDFLVFWDHKPGFPDSTFSAGTDEGFTFAEALEVLKARSGDYSIIAESGTWVLEKVGMSDTTFVAASGDRGWIAFGEGATAPTGRIMLWETAKSTVSNEVSVTDLVDNASDRVLGVGLNQNGTLGVLRGVEGVYFFDRNLTMVGSSKIDLGDAGAGAALHWAHNALNLDGEAAIAFIGSSGQTIKIMDTLHFYEINEIHIRDNIVGPLRVAPPLPTDNGGTGASCVGDGCVVAKLYGVTAVGGVVILDVLRRDVAH